jgi:creatinine amidohydrolase/Fe(II)-dependent formamide hydrolase-like protein
MRNLHKYEELFPDEFAAEVKRKPIVYCSFGPVEYHGPHGALGMDYLKGYEICLRAVEISGGIVYPVLPIAPGGNPLMNRDKLRAISKISYPSVFTSAELCEKLYAELFETFAEDIGFKVCVVMGSHGPAGILAKKIAAENPSLKGMKIIAAGSLSHNQDLIKAEYARLGIPRISHGGMWESAMLMVSNPELVDPEKLKAVPPGPAEEYSDKKYGPHTRPHYGEISKVSREFGERLIQTAAERIAAEALAALGQK